MMRLRSWPQTVSSPERSEKISRRNAGLPAVPVLRYITERPRCCLHGNRFKEPPGGEEGRGRNLEGRVRAGINEAEDVSKAAKQLISVENRVIATAGPDEETTRQKEGVSDEVH